MGTQTGKKAENGKGGNFDTRRNPFQNTRKPTGTAPELLASAGMLTALDKALGAGCAVLLGHTRDGGALVLTILDGDDRHRTYCATDEELDAAIIAMTDLYGG